MYFKLYHNPENKTLTIPRAALQLSGLADAEELILHTGGGYVLAARNALSTLECLHLLQFLTSTAASLLLQLAVFSQEGAEFPECEDTLDEEDEMDDPGLTIPACLLELAGLDEADSLEAVAEDGRVIVSKAELNALIETAEAIEADGYTEMSYRALQAAITAAKTVAANDDATTSEVTTAITDLASAIAGLEQITLDTSALEHEIELAEQILANIDDYVASTVEGLQEKVDAAKAALDNAASQAEIDEATKTLREARLSARTKADKSALNELIKTANVMDLSGYAQPQVLAFRRALVEAQQTAADEKATQEEVNAAAETLSKAMEKMTASTAAEGTDHEAAHTAASLQAKAFALLLITASLMAWMLRRKTIHS